MFSTIVLIVLILCLLGGLPRWPYSKNWGYAPTKFISTLLVLFLILMLVGGVRF